MILDMLAAGGSLLGSLGGLFGGGSAAKKQRRAAELQNLIAGTAYSPVNVNMPGGGGVTFGGGGSPQFGDATGGTQQITDPRTGKNVITNYGDGSRLVGEGKGSRQMQSDLGSVNLSLGDVDPMRQALTDLGTGLNLGGTAQQFGDLQQMGMPTTQFGLEQLFSSMGGLDAISALAGGAFGGAGADLDAFRQNIQNPMQQAMMSALGDASMTGAQTRDQTLALLREQAAPEIAREKAEHANNQFMTGQMGTSGGALQTEAFARGLGQADLQRQLIAGQEGRAATQSALNQMSGIGGLQDRLAQGATSRFQQLGDFANQLSNQRFERGQNLMQTGVDLAGIQNALLGLDIGTSGSILDQLGALQTMAMKPAELARGFMSDQANTRTGQAAGMNLNSMTAGSGDMAALLSQLGGALSGGGSIQDNIGTLWGGLKGMFGSGGSGDGSTPSLAGGYLSI